MQSAGTSGWPLKLVRVVREARISVAERAVQVTGPMSSSQLGWANQGGGPLFGLVKGLSPVSNMLSMS